MDILSILTILAAWLGLLSGGITLWLRIRDRHPRITIDSDVGDLEDWDEQFGPFTAGRVRWIYITNKSTRKVSISHAYAEWRRRRFFSPRRRIVRLTDPQRWENKNRLPTEDFWIEPWGSAVISVDADELEYGFRDQGSSGSLWYCLAVRDALGNVYRSKSERIEVKSLK